MTISSLPAELKYLAAFMRELVARELDGIDEDTDTTVLSLLLKNRIEDCTIEEAAAILLADRQRLDVWLQSQDAHPAHFISAFMSEPDALAPFLKTFRPPKGWKPRRVRAKPRKFVVMESPPGFEVRREGTGLFIYRGTEIGAREGFGIGFEQKGPWKKLLEEMVLQDPNLKFEPVAFGHLKGRQLLRDGKPTTVFLSDGTARYEVSVIDGNLSPIAPYLHTLAVDEREI
jgi:hypothetical protein